MTLTRRLRLSDARIRHLFEYETERVELPAETARRLSDAAGSALSVGLGDRPGSYTLTASNYVGSLVIDDVRVLIKPKIRAENLFLLLEAGISPDQWRQETFDWQTGPGPPFLGDRLLQRTAETSWREEWFARIELSTTALRLFEDESMFLLSSEARITSPIPRHV